jgi:hypothetical protein
LVGVCAAVWLAVVAVGAVAVSLPSITARPVAGAARPKVKLPGQRRFRPLARAEKLPPGSAVDVSGRAAIELISPSGGVMTFSGLQPGGSSKPDAVSSIFVYEGIARGFVQLALAGGDFSLSRRFTGKLAATKPARRLWGSGRGHFSTVGRYAAASDRGTIWEMADFTNGSLCVVKEGAVSVHDLVRHTTVLIRAGQSYFAHSR